jgi:hypothetical protein
MDICQRPVFMLCCVAHSESLGCSQSSGFADVSIAERGHLTELEISVTSGVISDMPCKLQQYNNSTRSTPLHALPHNVTISETEHKDAFTL